jgi:hypothetical protein
MPMRRIRSGCCAPAANGHAAAAPPSVNMNSRRRMWIGHATPPAGGRVHAMEGRYHALAKERTMLLRCESLEPPMSLAGQTRSLPWCPLHDRSSLESGSSSAFLLCRRSAISGCEQSQQTRSYSITSSAVASRVDGTVRPSAFAFLRLMMNSNLTDCWIGKSAGFSPLRIRAA